MRIQKSNIEKDSSMQISKKIEVDNVRELLLENVSHLSDIGAYGSRYQLKRFAGIDTNVILNKCTIEHGLAIWKSVCQIEVQHHVSCILTYSPYREKIIRELTDLNPLAIGPYIAYAEDYRPSEFLEKKKNEIGRVLLVMPIHSINGIESIYSLDQFIREIEKVKKRFDTVMVCLYIEDLKRGLWKPYKEKGYDVVSAGCNGPYFLSRLKYILSLSDALMLNEYSTGMAYAMYMGLPIHLVQQDIKYNTITCNNAYQIEGRKNEKIYTIFDNDQFMITDEQIKFGEYMFGLNNVKSKEEMKKILLSLTRTIG